MARRSANSLLNSLKGKIWLATSALAFFICTFGLISYLLVSFFIADTFYAVFIPFLFLSFTVMVFGWWLSNEVVAPIEKVSLLAKSLERSSLVSLPKTTGSTETDELLGTLHRTSQQLQTVVGLMESVSDGNLDVALTPLQNSDRLSSSFQKLLAKVSDSIHAKQNLEKLEMAVEQITSDAARIRRGFLETETSCDYPQTVEISETFNFLTRRLKTVTSQIREYTVEAQEAAFKAKKTIRGAIQTDEVVIQEMTQTALALKQMPNGADKISEEISVSISNARKSIEKALHTQLTAQANGNAADNLRRQSQDAIKRTGRLGECSEEITKVAKSVENLAHRTNLIALNASIQALENSDKSYGFSVLAEEVERLSARAENTNKEISSLNKSIASEIVEVEKSLKYSAHEAANLSKFAVETGTFLSELEKDVVQFLNLQSKIVSYSAEQRAENKQSFQAFSESIAVRQKAIENLQQSETDIANLSRHLENLQTSVNDFAPAQNAQNEIAAENSYAGSLVEPETIVTV
ncbi:MAG: methyl-accepting chemotaxis protein [Acidobacteriota bacterium]|nr:methyl-accepting chemotaxis protein [Acidobacteriota bacterium]